MLKVAHIVHPVIVEHTSDLMIAQPVTFETMRIARRFAKGKWHMRGGALSRFAAAPKKGILKGNVKIDLYAVQYHDEERIPLPRCFRRTPDLKRSVFDLKPFKQKRKLALIKDILDALYESANADYFIYTNVDIALQPYFYQTVSKIIEQGYDAFVINRRTITGKYTSIHEIPLMYGEVGEPHPGYDCFVFKREMYPGFKLGEICIGTAWIGRALLVNLVTCGTKFKEFGDLYLTFHIGDTRSWLQGEYSDYFSHNRDELLKIFDEIEAERGKYEPVWRSYLIDFPRDRQFPEFA